MSRQYLTTDLYFPLNTLGNSHAHLIGVITMISGRRYVKTAVIVTNRNLVADVRHSNLTGICFTYRL
jgi:hypothetical protein